MDAFALLKKLGFKQTEATKERFLDDSDFYMEVAKEVLCDPAF